MTSEAQRRYLRRMFAARAAAVPLCDCPGCHLCKGMVKGCTCDESMDQLRDVLKSKRSGGLSSPVETAPTTTNYASTPDTDTAPNPTATPSSQQGTGKYTSPDPNSIPF